MADSLRISLSDRDVEQVTILFISFVLKLLKRKNHNEFDIIEIIRLYFECYCFYLGMVLRSVSFSLYNQFG